MPELLPMAAARRSSRARWQLAVNAPVLGWLLAAVVAGLAHNHLIEPTWLIVHLALLGGAMTSILIWSEHFAEALLHLPPSSRAESLARLIGFQVGALTVIIGVSFTQPLAVVFGGLLCVVVVGWHGVELALRARAARSGRLALAGRHGYVVRYYVAAMGWFVVAGIVGTALGTGSVPAPWDDRLHLLHVETMVYGVMLLTIVGTLFTLWPTMLRSFMPEDTKAGANRSLVLLTAGVGVGCVGDLAGSPPVAAGGLALVAAGVIRAAIVFRRAVKRPRKLDAPVAAMVASAGWLIGVLAANGWVLLRPGPFGAVADATSVLVLPVVVGFVGQVLLGSLTYLLPVVAGGGPTAVRAAISSLGRWWHIRWLALNGGLLLVVIPADHVPGTLHRIGATAVALALVSFILFAARLMLRRPAKGS